MPLFNESSTLFLKITYQLKKKERKLIELKENHHFLDFPENFSANSFRYIRLSLNKFQTFFVWGLLLIVHTWNSSPLPSNLLRRQCSYTVPTTSGRPHWSPLVWAGQWPSSQPLSSQLSHNDSLWALGISKSHREQGLEGEELSWCPSWWNSLWQGWSCGLVHCPGGNATEPIWRVLASSDGISSWTPLKPQRSNPNPNPLANQLCCIEFLTPPTPLIIPHRLPGFLESLLPLKNWRSIHARCCKSSLKHSIRFCGIFSKFNTEFFWLSFFQNVLTSRLEFWNSPAVTIRIL